MASNIFLEETFLDDEDDDRFSQLADEMEIEKRKRSRVPQNNIQ